MNDEITTALSARPLESKVRQREYLEWAQMEADQQNRLIYEAALNQAQFENMVCSIVQQVTAMNSCLVLGAFYFALRDA